MVCPGFQLLELSLRVILSEAKDLTQPVPSHILPCVTPASIVRFLALLGMTMLRQRRDFIVAWGNVPGFVKRKSASAEGAIHLSHQIPLSIACAAPAQLKRAFSTAVFWAMTLGRCPRLR